MDHPDLHEWLSFDLDDVTYQFDVTFLTSSWTCIYGSGCPGIAETAAPQRSIGCCEHGAHFTSKKDRKHIAALAAELSPSQWQLKDVAAAMGGPIAKNDDGDWVTQTWEGACVFLNRPGFAAGPGCALHQAALAAGARPLDWKPDVCWQLPLRLEPSRDTVGHLTLTLREWKRRDWGEGGEDFHWWCTETHEAFVGERPVYEALAEEITEMVGADAYDRLRVLLDERPRETLLPHPAVRR